MLTFQFMGHNQPLAKKSADSKTKKYVLNTN